MDLSFTHRWICHAPPHVRGIPHVFWHHVVVDRRVPPSAPAHGPHHPAWTRGSAGDPAAAEAGRQRRAEGRLDRVGRRGGGGAAGRGRGGRGRSRRHHLGRRGRRRGCSRGVVVVRGRRGRRRRRVVVVATVVPVVPVVVVMVVVGLWAVHHPCGVHHGGGCFSLSAHGLFY